VGLIKVQVVPQPLGLTPLTVPAIALALCLGCGTGYAQERPADLAMGLFVDATTLWGQYQALIEVTIGVIVFQSALITAFLIQFFRRKRAEGSLKSSEDRWRSVVENPIFGISFIDGEHRFIATNPTYQRMIGYTNEELRHLTPLDISVPGEREANEMLFKELRDGKRQHYEMVKQLRRKDGKLIWIELYVFAIPDAETKAQLMFEMMQDITDSKRSQDALEATRAELVRVARINSFGAMTASIAHEINQPLAAMVANANAAQRWLASAVPDLDEVRAALKRISADGHRAAELVQGIRAMFKNDGQKRVPVDVNQLAREVLALVQVALLDRRIAVYTELSAELPQVMADRVQLQQVIMNLVTNAIDAMESVADRPQILRVKSETGDGDVVVVAIEDSGVGIDPEKLDRLFDSFFTTKPHGMGMGLSICRSIIEAHNGRLWASPGTPYGSVFRFELPIRQDPPERRLPGLE
jgi:PAS domain S-box-containing protein